MTIGRRLSAGALGTMLATGPIKFRGGAPLTIAATNGGFVDFGVQTVTISGTPAFSTAFAYELDGGNIGASNTTFSGSATGTRCQISGPINLGGFDPNVVFPGNT